jgi:hypothetical protein
MRINPHELKPLEVLIDIVGFYALVLFWTLLLYALPFPVFLMMEKVHWASKIWSFLIFVAILLMVTFIIKWIAKSAISRSRTVLAFISLTFFGFAFHNSFLLINTEFQSPQHLSTIGNTIIQYFLGISCMMQIFSKKRI